MSFKYTELQRAWLDDLKKTRAKQGTGRLHRKDGWCCLGRACKVMGVKEVRGEFSSKFDGVDTVMSIANGERMGLRSGAGDARLQFRIDGGRELGRLWEANDDYYTFKQIAAAIEADPENFFTEGAA